MLFEVPNGPSSTWTVRAAPTKPGTSLLVPCWCNDGKHPSARPVTSGDASLSSPSKDTRRSSCWTLNILYCVSSQRANLGQELEPSRNKNAGFPAYVEPFLSSNTLKLSKYREKKTKPHLYGVHYRRLRDYLVPSLTYTTPLSSVWCMFYVAKSVRYSTGSCLTYLFVSVPACDCVSGRVCLCVSMYLSSSKIIYSMGSPRKKHLIRNTSCEQGLQPNQMWQHPWATLSVS